MRFVVTVFMLLVLVFQASAQRNLEAEDDKQAVTFYRQAVALPKDDGPLDESQIEFMTCRRLSRFVQLEWLENYSSERTQTLGKMGIRPEVVKIFEDRIASSLIKNLDERIRENRPMKYRCSYCICRGEMCGMKMYDLSKVYLIVDLLESLAVKFPSEYIVQVELNDAWKKSFRDDSTFLKNDCLQRIENLPNWRKYESCRAVSKALRLGMDPVSLGIEDGIVQMLASIKE